MAKKNTDFNFSVKSMQEDGSFAGYASVFGIVDSQNDAVLKGAFKNSLLARAGRIKLLWQHQITQPIGVFTLINEDSYGLYIEGRLLLDLQRGSEAYSLLKSGAINGLSIGYSVISAGYNPENNIRLITDLELCEISIVTFPANEAAVVTSVKSYRNNSCYGFSASDEDGALESIQRGIDILSP